MQDNTTSKKVSKKAAKKPTRRVSKKTARKPVANVSKKTTRRTSDRASGGPAETPPAAPSEKAPRNNTLESGKQPILVPVDFSAHSVASLEHAADMAQCMRSPITVLHVVHDPGDAPGYYQVKGRKKQLRRLEDVAREMLDEFMEKIAKRHPKQVALKQAKRLLVTGLPITRILEVAEKLEPSIVVMGSAGRTGLSRILLGSKAEQVVRTCPYTVTIVKLPAGKK
jgi:nucleotide-binding universal stress UspA family protein